MFFAVGDETYDATVSLATRTPHSLYETNRRTLRYIEADYQIDFANVETFLACKKYEYYIE